MNKGIKKIRIVREKKKESRGEEQHRLVAAEKEKRQDFSKKKIKKNYLLKT